MSTFDINILTDWRYTGTRSRSRIPCTAFLIFIEAMPAWGCNKKSDRCSSTRSRACLRGWMALDQYLNKVSGINQDPWSAAFANTKEIYKAAGVPGIVSFGCCDWVIGLNDAATAWLHRNSVVRTRTRCQNRSDAFRLCLKQTCQHMIVLQKQGIPKFRYYMQSVLSVLSGGMSTRPGGE